MNQEPQEFLRSGLVAVAGPPNAGKSTLLNNLLGQKISIVSPKPQTTRNRVLGVLNGPGYQLVLLDTPGLHGGTIALNAEMRRVALETLAEADLVLFLLDATAPPPKPGGELAEYLAGIKTPVLLGLNKIDLLRREKLLPLIAACQNLREFTAVVPLSARSGDGLPALLDEITRLLPEGPRYFPDDIPTDVTVRSLAAEIIREKVFLLTGQEVPYSTAVVIDRFEEGERLTTIDATIVIERDSQKAIVIGKKGAKLKEIGTAARLDIETMLDARVLLKIWVKVVKNWSRDPRLVRELGM
ncbi:MAG: GTPase Era [Desulfobacteraceae bacterium]|nr:GTPase Era [Desulfobacteraceae bacterium]